MSDANDTRSPSVAPPPRPQPSRERRGGALLAAPVLDEDLFMLGGADVPVFLLKLGGGCWALVEGGVSHRAQALWDELLAVVGDPAGITHWCITHKHYDHCGLLPYWLPRLPAARVVASEATCAAWRNPKTCEVIAAINAQLGAVPAGFAEAPMAWADMPLLPVAPGQSVVLGPRHALEVLAAGGHASDQVVYYDRSRQRLFASDALGEYDDADGQWRPLVFDDGAQYLATLKSLQDLPVRQLVPGHGGLLAGPAAGNAARDAWADYLGLENRVHQRLVQGDRLDGLARELHADWAALSSTFVPPALHLASMRRMNSLISALHTC